ncbi:MAG: hypothetical protein A2Y16_01400 [Tenericutes bacterium GWF2_57_13]|nr:MAG: hypothetical protein A2Y16_01400 [Tenericutes bacterium GWF2_57_13]
MKISTETVRRLSAGDEDAFNETYYTYARLIHYLAYTLVKDRGAAEDLVQEAFVKMYENIGKLSDPNRFQAWFITMAERLALDHLRQMKRDPTQNAVELTAELVDAGPDYVPERFDFNGILPPFENHVVNLKIVHRMTFRDIADMTGKTMSVVTKAYYDAVEKLKKQYRKGAL